MPGKLNIPRGARYDRLVVIGEAPGLGSERAMFVRCDCGTELVVRLHALRRANTRSCGCIKREAMTARNMRHGLSSGPEYHAWFNMVARCDKPENAGFANYGGRGIAVCPEWRGSFVAFLRDMGPRPSPRHSLDRINNNGNYEPSNCRWATWGQQCRNMRRNRFITSDGLTLTVAEWGERTGLSVGVIWHRVFDLHWAPSVALRAPVRPMRKYVRGARRKATQDRLPIH